ncbi:MAG: hypothetical protein P8174_03225 [Gemmatimonadota bacterium]|jgi:hypothetical protein
MRRMVAFSVSALLLFPAVSVAQARQETQPDSVAPPRLTVTAGGGVSMGPLGAQAEWYLWPGRLSLFGGLGYTSPGKKGYPEGPTYAGGTRLYTSGVKHRAFVALVVGQLLVSETISPYPGLTLPGERQYGPALMGGYQRIADSGFTFMVALGVGYALPTRDLGSSVTPALDLGFGYTWR